MVWSGKIIAEWFRAVFADKDCSGIADFHHYFKWVGSYNLHMFRSNGVGCFNGFIHVFCDQNITKVIQRFLDDLFTGKDFDEAVNFFADFCSELFAGRDQDGRSKLVMFCL